MFYAVQMGGVNGVIDSFVGWNMSRPIADPRPRMRIPGGKFRTLISTLISGDEY
jgi:hypothetical protein